MQLRGPAATEAVCLMGQFEELRRILSQPEYAPHRDRPLAYWVEVSDRRLPVPFLSRTIGQLIATPFESLLATPGVGQKKMNTLICLLERVRRTDPSVFASHQRATDQQGDPVCPYGKMEVFDPGAVSELMWENWRQSVRWLQLEDEPLGRLASSLRSLTRGLWERPLSYYLGFSLEEICRLRTHGQKRLRAILEVFYHIHRVAMHLPPDVHLAFRMIPRAIRSAERWMDRVLACKDGIPTREETTSGLICPLLEQLKIDGKQAHVDLAAARLGLSDQKNSIRQIARRLNLTRARIYQLLDEIAEIIKVRWPEGSAKLQSLLDRVTESGGGDASQDVLEELRLCMEVFFGANRSEKNSPNSRGLSTSAQRLQGNGEAGVSPNGVENWLSEDAQQVAG